MKIIELSAESRAVVGKQVKKLRQKNELPAVVYGRDVKSRSLVLDLPKFITTYKEAGSSSLVDLSIDGEKPIKVLIQEPQIHYLTSQPQHVDFYAVRMSEKLETELPIHFIGSSNAVEELEGNFIANKNELKIKCLPADLIPSVEVDISVLKEFEDQVRVKDIRIPDSIEVLDDPEDVVALVTPPLSDEELEAELAEDKTEEAAAVEALSEEGAEGEAAEPSSDDEPKATETNPE